MYSHTKAKLDTTPCLNLLRLKPMSAKNKLPRYKGIDTQIVVIDAWYKLYKVATKDTRETVKTMMQGNYKKPLS